MKLILRLLIIAILSYFLPYYLPWWSVALISFLAGLVIPGPGLNVFISGFLGVGLIWSYLAWQIDSSTGSILTEKVASLLTLDNSMYLLIATGLIGAIVGGLSCSTGNSFRQIFIKKKPRSLYS